MRRIDWASALVFSGTLLMSVAIPGLFAYRICGHRLMVGLQHVIGSADEPANVQDHR